MLPPLRFEPRCFEKVWGGRRLESLGLSLPPAAPIGEVWLVVDRAEEQSVVAEGPCAGATLEELMRRDRAALLGRSRPAASGRFPLLVKFIDAAHRAGDARVVDQHIETARPIFDCGKQRIDRLAPGHVGLVRHDAGFVPAQGLQAVAENIADMHRRAAVREGLRHHATDAARSARDEHPES